MTTYYKPKEGRVWNPLAKLPPNMPCPCQSGIKFKKCCRQFQPATIDKAALPEFEKAKKLAEAGEKAW